VTAWRRLALPALLAAAPVIFFHEICLFGRAFLLRDLYTWFYPWRDLARTAFASGDFPLWNPWSYLGTPFLANMQSGLLYPLNAVFWILDFPAAMRLFIVLQFAVAAMLMHAFLRALACRPAAALTGALAWAYGGWMIVHIEFPNKLAAAAWLPLLCLALWRWMQGAVLRGLALGAAAVALSLAAGYPQTAATVWLGAAVVWLCFVAWPRAASPRAGVLSRAVSLPAMTLLGCVVAAAQLLPFAEAAAGSDRAAGRDVAQVLSLSLHPGHLLGLLLPHLFGEPGYQRYWGGDLYQFWLGHFYVGLPVAVLAVISPFAWRAARPAAGTAASSAASPLPSHARAAPAGGGGWPMGAGLVLLVLSVLVCLGEATPVAPVLVALVPGLGYFRWFSTTSVLIAFALCWLAALGLERLLSCAGEDPAAARRLAAGAAGMAALLAVVAVVSLAAPAAFLSLVRTLVSPVMLTDQEPFLARHIAVVRWDVLRATLLAAGLALLAAAAARRRISWTAAAWGVPLAVFLDLLGASAGMNHASDPSLYTAPPSTLQQVREAMPPLARLYVTGDTLEKDLALYGEDNDAYFRWAAGIFLFNLNLPYRLFSASDGDPLRPARMGVWHREVEATEDLDRRRRLLAAAGVSHVLRGEPGEKAEMIDVPGALPRAWVSSGAVHVGGKEAFERLASPDWDPRRETLVEEDAPLALRPPGPPAAHRVHGVRHTHDTVTVDVESEDAGYLVLGDMMAPGWTAQIDGAETALFTANFLFRGVALPAGRHTVEFLYRPASVRWGAVLSIAGVAVLAVLFWMDAAARRRSARPANAG
jgi:hypothetical protein